MELEAIEAAAGRMLERGEIAEALGLFRQALALAPNDSRRIANVAAILRMTGELREAAAYASRAFLADPANVLAFRLCADLCAPDELAPLATRAEGTIATERIRGGDLASLHYACCLARHRLGDFSAAYDHASKGAALRRAGRVYDVEADIAVIDRIVATHRPPAIAFDAAASPSSAIFVMGLPRSGTTLMEQLILRGGEASSLGERSNLQDAVIGEMRSRGLGAGSRADAAEKAAQINAKGMYRRYIDSVRSLGIGGQFVDKTPMNVLYAGLIAAGCAGARTVCMLREPKDLVAGIFRTDFGGLYPFALDPVDLAKYVKAFGRLVTHWNSTIPPTLFRAVRYEDLAANPTREGAATFAFMGLRWRDQFVESKAGPAVAVSASAAQVHAPIDTSRVAVWRVYEAHMAEAFELLAD